MIKKQWLKFIFIFSGIILLILCLFYPIPYYIEIPGKAVPVSDYVKVPKYKTKANGTFRLVYVNLMHATLATYVWSYTQNYATRISADEVTGTDNDKQYNKVQEYYMDDALNEAKYVALKLANKKVKRTYEGIYVMSILNNSNFRGKLKVGDTIIAINGKHYNSTQGFMYAIESLNNHEKIKVTYERATKKHVISGRTIKLEQTGKVGIGITLANRSKVTSPVKIVTHMDSLGGPSAGLMITLQLYSQLSQKDLLKGRNVAGTGTISADGSVGDIGGVDKKVVASARAGATIFFVPNNAVSKAELNADSSAKNNYEIAKETAKKIGTKMKIVPVKNISDAIKYLKNKN